MWHDTLTEQWSGLHVGSRRGHERERLLDQIKMYKSHSSLRQFKTHNEKQGERDGVGSHT